MKICPIMMIFELTIPRTIKLHVLSEAILHSSLWKSNSTKVCLYQKSLIAAV